MLTFEKDVQFKSGITPICLPSKTPRLLQEKFVKKGVYITGWGATSFRGRTSTLFVRNKKIILISGPTSNELLYGNIQVTSEEECIEKFQQFKNGNNNLLKL